MAIWKKVITTADDADYKNSNVTVSGDSYETIFTHKRYANMTSTTWRGGSQTSSTHSAQVWSLGTGIQAGTVPVNYSDTSMSSWVGIQYAMWQAPAACEVESWTAQGQQNSTNMDLRLGLWKGNAITSIVTNHSAAGQVVDFIGYIDFDANADTNCIHPAQTITGSSTSMNNTARTLATGDMLYIFATQQPGNTGTDSTYWQINNSVRIKYT